MTDDEKIIELFFERSEEAIWELNNKYGKILHSLSCNIVGCRQDAEECVNDAYLGAWNAIPPARPNPLLPYVLKIVRNISLKLYWRKKLLNEAAGVQSPCRRLKLVSQIRKLLKIELRPKR